MNAEEISDERLHRSPKVYRTDDGDIRISYRVLTPLRFYILHELVYCPLLMAWRFFMTAFVIYAVLAHFNAFAYTLPLSQGKVLGVMAILALLWMTERMARFPMARLFAGISIRIKISKDAIFIKTGFFRTKRFSRSQQVTFAAVPFDTSHSAIYRNSRLMCVIVNDTRRASLIEVFDTVLLLNLVNNANVALSLTGRGSEAVINQRRRQMNRRIPEVTTQQSNFLQRLFGK